jgi:murein DD-endopeptidase MepM/ murein hydrolase activator NlpD
MEAIKPIKDGYISSGYGWRTDPFNPGKKQFHPGIDVSCKEVKPLVCTPLAGVVVVTGFSETFGNRVWIKLDNGLFMVLAHLDSIDLHIRNGLQLKAGDIVGIMGNTGMSHGAHTHIEIRKSPYTPGNSREPTEIINTFKP